MEGTLAQNLTADQSDHYARSQQTRRWIAALTPQRRRTPIPSIRNAGGRAALKTAELCPQVIEGCGRECDPGAGSCDGRRIGQAIGRTMLPAPPVFGTRFLVTDSEELPGSALAAYERAASAGFHLACEADVGRLPAALAAAVPSGGRVLEIGTGVGVVLAGWSMGLERAGTSRSSRSRSMMRCSGRRCQRHGRRGFASSQVTGPRSSAASASLT